MRVTEGMPARAPWATKAQISRECRQHIGAQIYDDSTAAGAVAIYALSDPRSLREVRYIGQTTRPARRLLQHLNTARLWIPDDIPWWVKSPKFRPLYEWIRLLYRDGRRLPSMLIGEWVPAGANARLVERARICACLALQQPLLNVEPRLASPQLLLF